MVKESPMASQKAKNSIEADCPKCGKVDLKNVYYESYERITKSFYFPIIQDEKTGAYHRSENEEDDSYHSGEVLENMFKCNSCDNEVTLPDDVCDVMYSSCEEIHPKDVGIDD